MAVIELMKERGTHCAHVRLRRVIIRLRPEENTMSDRTNPRDLDMVDRVGAGRGPNEGRDDGVGKWFGLGLGIWSVVIVIALVFAVAILVFAR
jgi:hypothetical protein